MHAPARRRAALRRRHELHQRHQRLHHQGPAASELPDDDAGRVRRDRPAAGARAVHAAEPRLDRDAGRRDLRQRRGRPALQRRCSTRTWPRSSVPSLCRSPGSPTVIAAEEGASPRHKRGGAAKRARRRRPSGSTTPALPRSSASTTPTTPRRRPPSTRRGSPTRRCRRRARPSRRRSRCPTRARSRRSTRSSAVPAPAGPGAGGTRRRHGSHRPGPRARRPTPARVCSASTTRCPTRCWSAARTRASGHPLAVMGPQVSYFAPQILMEEDIHGPGIDADGAAFPGVNLYVELGHGTDYAWSATSAGQNIIDTFAVPLCNPSGGAVVARALTTTCCTASAWPMETLTDQESWSPNLADSTPAGSITLQTQRTAFGIVSARATIKAQARRLHQPALDLHARAGLGDRLCGLQQPRGDAHPAGLLQRRQPHRLHVQLVLRQQQAHRVLQLGPEPGARRRTPTRCSRRGRGDAWKGLHRRRPDDAAEPHRAGHGRRAATPTSSTSPTSPAGTTSRRSGFGDPATGQQYSSIYRSQLLDNNIQYYLKRDHNKMTLADLVNAMGDRRHPGPARGRRCCPTR